MWWLDLAVSALTLLGSYRASSTFVLRKRTIPRLYQQRYGEKYELVNRDEVEHQRLEALRVRDELNDLREQNERIQRQLAAQERAKDLDTSTEPGVFTPTTTGTVTSTVSVPKKRPTGQRVAAVAYPPGFLTELDQRRTYLSAELEKFTEQRSDWTLIFNDPAEKFTLEHNKMLAKCNQAIKRLQADIEVVDGRMSEVAKENEHARQLTENARASKNESTHDPRCPPAEADVTLFSEARIIKDSNADFYVAQIGDMQYGPFASIGAAQQAIIAHQEATTLVKRYGQTAESVLDHVNAPGNVITRTYKPGDGQSMSVYDMLTTLVKAAQAQSVGLPPADVQAIISSGEALQQVAHGILTRNEAREATT